MDKLINIKKQIISLKFCYEELVLENKALELNNYLLVKFFKLTKQYAKKQKIIKTNFDYNFQKDKSFETLLNRKKNLKKNVDKSNNTLKKSLLYNKFEELTKEKEYLIQSLKEKSSVLQSVQEELKAYKINNPYSNYNKFISLKSKFFLNDTIDISFNKNNYDKNNYDDNISLINSKFKKIINKEKISLVKLIGENISQLKNILNYSKYHYIKKIKELGFNSTLKNKKYNKTYKILIEPNQLNNNNSSDSDSDEDNIKLKKPNSINDFLYYGKINSYSRNNSRKKILPKIKYLNTESNNNNTLKNERNASYYNMNKTFEINNEFSYNLKGNKRYIETEYNEGNNDELNKQFLKIKENYYKCLDKRYELKNALKGNISKIYKIKTRIKKIKKQNNID